MRVIAIVNQKGGSGKTTVSVNLAAALVEQQRKVLLIDIDPQANSSLWLGLKEEDRGLLDVFVNGGSLLDVIRETPFGIDVAPSSTWMVQAEKQLIAEVGAETVLRRAIERLPEHRWDYVLIDCPPTLGILVVNALAAAREVLVPVQAQVLSLVGLVQLHRTLDLVKERINADLNLSGIVPCRVDSRTRHSKEVVDSLRETFGEIVHEATIRENVRIAEAPSFAQPITSYDPHSRGAADFRLLAQEVIDKESLYQ
jgi:chromosome partitioning protein